MAGRDEIGNLWIGLTMDTAAFEKGATIAEKRMASWGKRMEGVGKRIGQVGTIMTASITLPLTAFATKAFDVAKDAAELQSAFDQTFGSMSGAMNKWAVATGNAMGRSTRELQEGANAFGLYFNQAAKTRAEAAKMSQTFTVLAQDLSSFHNTSVDEALAALRSGLSGETEPLRRYGVFLNEAAVASKAAEMGIVAVNGKLTDQQKIMARAALITEQTANAQGDVARTADSTANQMRRAAAAFEELQIIVGTKLLPVLTPLIEKLASALEWFTKLPTPVQNVALAVAGVTAVLGPLMMAFGPLLPLLVKLGPAFLALKAGLAAATVALAALRVPLLALLANPLVLGAAVTITGIYLAWKNWDKIAPIVQRMVSQVAGALKALAAPFKWVMDQTRAISNAFYTMADKVVFRSYVPDMVEGIARSMSELGRVFVDPAVSATDKVAAAFQGLANIIGSIFGHKAGSIVSSLGNLAMSLAPFFGGGALTGSAAFAGSANTVGMARGGSGVFGGFGGVDKNVLSLNGSPIARVSRGEHFRVSPANDGLRVQVVKGDLFDVIVDRRAGAVAAPMVGQGTMVAAGGAMAGMQRRQSRILP